MATDNKLRFSRRLALFVGLCLAVLGPVAVASDDPNSPDYETQHVVRFKAFVPVTAAFRDKCNQELEGAGFGPNNFSIPMVGSGDADDAEPTYYASDWQCTADEYAIIEPILTTWACKVVKQHERDKKVIESNVAATQAKAGQVLTFSAAATDMGLKRRVVEMGME